MNVAYDISLLGLGLQSAKCRTGIHRVVENTFQQLVQTDQINVLKVSLMEGQTIRCQQYLDAYLSPPEKLHSIFKVPESQITKERVKEELKCLKERAKCSSSLYFGLQLKRIFLKARHRRALRSQAICEFFPESLEGVDIFHSPFDPIPDEVKSLRSLTCFETIYDLILIKHPEFFRGNEQEAYRKRLSSFTGDEWLCCISNSTRNDLLEVNPNLDPDRVRVTHLAASSDFYPCDSSEEFERVRNKYGLPDGTYFLCLSTFEPRKNLITAIRAFVNLVRSGECPDASLVLVGSLGWDYDSILKEIDGAKEAKKQIYSTGYVEDSDLATIYSNALAFVYMSYYEGFGLPPLEAMQCGVPVITSDNSSLPEVVGDAGVLLDADDLDGLQHAMLSFYDDAELRSSYSAKALSRASLFSWGNCVQQTVEAYQDALS
jgi:glycosyltransferase involved in cell wall biosynthesis